MALSDAQRAALKAHILANEATVVYAGQATPIKDVPNTADGNFEIARWYTEYAAPEFKVWRTNVLTQEIFDQIVWANMTPNPTPDGTAAWTNRSLACQGKQFNLQTLLMGQTTINAAKASLRNGLQDALTDIPSGANGNLRQAGWANVQLAIQRAARRIEQLFATGTGSEAAPGTMVYEGTISGADVEAARN